LQAPQGRRGGGDNSISDLGLWIAEC
jgi:hypothetical protein